MRLILKKVEQIVLVERTGIINCNSVLFDYNILIRIGIYLWYKNGNKLEVLLFQKIR